MSRAIKGVVFDMDGTLCLPQTHMFREMREALGITKAVDILDFVHSLPEDKQEEAQEKLRIIERRAMHDMIPQPGLTTMMDFVVEQKLKATILTRNFPIPVDYLRRNFLKDYPMDPIITREFRPPKPAPDGILHIARNWQVKPSELIMVGDSEDDIYAGHRAGSLTVLLLNEHNSQLADLPEVTWVIKSLPELIEILKSCNA